MGARDLSESRRQPHTHKRGENKQLSEKTNGCTDLPLTSFDIHQDTPLSGFSEGCYQRTRAAYVGSLNFFGQGPEVARGHGVA